MTAWFQANFALQSQPRGFHLVTREVVSHLENVDQIETGLLHLFIQHTSASLTINENADPDVRVDMETAANLICPETMPFVHTCEGPDDMPAHVKASFFGAGLTIPISDGRLALGTWQGIYLCEHRNRGGSRSNWLPEPDLQYAPSIRYCVRSTVPARASKVSSTPWKDS